MNKILKIIVVVGVLVNSSLVWSKTEDAFRASIAPTPQVVFFQQEEGYLVPKCRVSVERYPEILPLHLKQKMNDRLALTGGEGDNHVLDLEQCGSELSLKLVNEARYFDTEIKTAAGPLAGIAVASAASCFVVGGATYLVSFFSELDDALFGSDLFLIGVYGLMGINVGTHFGSVGSDILKASGGARGRGVATAAKLLVAAPKLAGAAVGAACVVAGGVLGYIHGTPIMQELKAAKARVAELEELMAVSEEQKAAIAQQLEAAKTRVAELEELRLFVSEEQKTAIAQQLKAARARVAELLEVFRININWRPELLWELFIL